MHAAILRMAEVFFFLDEDVNDGDPGVIWYCRSWLLGSLPLLMLLPLMMLLESALMQTFFLYQGVRRPEP